MYPRFFDISSPKYPYVVNLTCYPSAICHLNLQPQQRNSTTVKKRYLRKSNVAFRHRSRRGSSTRAPSTTDLPAVPPLGSSKTASSIPAVPTVARHEASPLSATSSTQRLPVAPFAELTRTIQSPPKPSGIPPPHSNTINLRPYDLTAPQTFFVPPHRPSDLYVEVGPSRRIVL